MLSHNFTLQLLVLLADLEYSVALMALPYIFDEKPGFLYVSDKKEIVSPTPVLVLQCSTIKPDAISVWAEGCQVCQGISSIWYGVVLLMAVYYAHGIDYAPEAANTLGFLQRYMMSIKKEDEGPKIPTPILRLLSALI
ncbi:uncharacterized protein [Apostichopus japonicus]|uniref:uncharacterized protein isoform X1 n=2 Tax=Stichopus japonicus TaxID=307972 RepID=UPI003AB458F1